jgi:hypothetical protein
VWGSRLDRTYHFGHLTSFSSDNSRECICLQAPSPMDTPLIPNVDKAPSSHLTYDARQVTLTSIIVRFQPCSRKYISQPLPTLRPKLNRNLNAQTNNKLPCIVLNTSEAFIRNNMSRQVAATSQDIRPVRLVPPSFISQKTESSSNHRSPCPSFETQGSPFSPKTTTRTEIPTSSSSSRTTLT